MAPEHLSRSVRHSTLGPARWSLGIENFSGTGWGTAKQALVRVSGTPVSASCLHSSNPRYTRKQIQSCASESKLRQKLWYCLRTMI